MSGYLLFCFSTNVYFNRVLQGEEKVVECFFSSRLLPKGCIENVKEGLASYQRVAGFLPARGWFPRDEGLASCRWRIYVLVGTSIFLLRASLGLKGGGYFFF